MGITVDRSRCVLCGRPNECVLARREAQERDGSDSPQSSTESCWCVAEVFPESLTLRASDRDGGESCICRACLEQAREEQAREKGSRGSETREGITSDP